MYDNCPHCGAQLAAALVADIRNPSEEASCPRSPKKPTQEPVAAPIPLATLFAIAHYAKAAS